MTVPLRGLLMTRGLNWLVYRGIHRDTPFKTILPQLFFITNRGKGSSLFLSSQEVGSIQRREPSSSKVTEMSAGILQRMQDSAASCVNGAVSAISTTLNRAMDQVQKIVHDKTAFFQNLHFANKAKIIFFAISLCQMLYQLIVASRQKDPKALLASDSPFLKSLSTVISLSTIFYQGSLLDKLEGPYLELARKSQAIKSYAYLMKDSSSSSAKEKAVLYIEKTLDLIRSCSQNPEDTFDLIFKEFKDLPEEMKDSPPSSLYEKITLFSEKINLALFEANSGLVKAINRTIALAPSLFTGIFNRFLGGWFNLKLDGNASWFTVLIGAISALYVADSQKGVGIDGNQMMLAYLPRIIEAFNRRDFTGLIAAGSTAFAGSCLGNWVKTKASDINKKFIGPAHKSIENVKKFYEFLRSNFEKILQVIDTFFPGISKLFWSQGKEKRTRLILLILSYVIAYTLVITSSAFFPHLTLITNQIMLTSLVVGYVFSKISTSFLDMHYLKKEKRLLEGRKFHVIEGRSDRNSFFRALILYNARRTEPSLSIADLKKRAENRMDAELAEARNRLKEFIRDKGAYLEDIEMMLASKKAINLEKLLKDLEKGSAISAAHIQFVANQLGIKIAIHNREEKIAEYLPGIMEEKENSVDEIKTLFHNTSTLHLFHRSSDNTYHWMIPREEENNL